MYFQSGTEHPMTLYKKNLEVRTKTRSFVETCWIDLNKIKNRFYLNRFLLNKLSFIFETLKTFIYLCCKIQKKQKINSGNLGCVKGNNGINKTMANSLAQW
jgi:hypothetical protein